MHTALRAILAKIVVQPIDTFITNSFKNTPRCGKSIKVAANSVFIWPSGAYTVHQGTILTKNAV